MEITNLTNLPLPLVEAIRNDTYIRGDADYTVTQLIDPPQLVYLTKKYQDQLTEDAADRIYSLLGQAIHTILERSESTEDSMIERRLKALYDDISISGQIDRVDFTREGQVIVQDWKVASTWEYIYGIKPSRIQQLNCYAQLLRDDMDIWPTKLEVVYIFRDWQKSKATYAKKDDNYPKHQVAVLEIPLWDRREALKFIKNKIKLHLAYPNHYLPHQIAELNNPNTRCTDEERWKNPTRWAVRNPEAKRAMRVFDTTEEAEIFMQNQKNSDLIIEKRTSEPKRCNNYCPVSEFCQQYQTELQMEGVK